MAKSKLYFETGDPQEIENLEALNLTVSNSVGVGTTVATSRLTIDGDILVTGIITAKNFSGEIGVGTITNLKSETIICTGSVGVGTSSSSSNLHVVGNTLISGMTTIQSLVVSGITTVGLGSTSRPSNSQLTFELTSNTNLRIKVRGTDGVLRSGNITLS